MLKYPAFILLGLLIGTTSAFLKVSITNQDDDYLYEENYYNMEFDHYSVSFESDARMPYLEQKTTDSQTEHEDVLFAHVDIDLSRTNSEGFLEEEIVISTYVDIENLEEDNQYENEEELFIVAHVDIDVDKYNRDGFLEEEIVISTYVDIEDLEEGNQYENEEELVIVAHVDIDVDKYNTDGFLEEEVVISTYVDLEMFETDGDQYVMPEEEPSIVVHNNIRSENDANNLINI